MEAFSFFASQLLMTQIKLLTQAAAHPKRRSSHLVSERREVKKVAKAI
jgi:hypothetical protein